ncbi:hypothetical protein KGF86_01735 [Ornithinibacillus massiliensis]|uniref:Uncharacterized protein n=1 Tax=Ornithinibacillus massiliensis TaxID=1944633 RepID=A0ABS5M9D0_9BACI|nr:hypothetical protein [Ornithinibacillus massiliensis]MBS3678925.1 hypothetical protein [Ornithinibacillus massiliensis]
MAYHFTFLKSYTDNENKKIYNFTNTYPFKSLGKIKYEYALSSFAFAYNMSFSAEGHHRVYRSGGTEKRKKVQVFCDTFIGKLGEFAVYQYFKDNGIQLPYPDLTIMGEGEWDSYDFTFENRKIGVKTTKTKGNLLLLETKDWNENAQYLPNLKKGSATYTDFLFVRVDTNIVSNLKQKWLYKNDYIDKKVLEEEFQKSSCNFDIAYIPIALVKQAIQQKAIIEKDSYLYTTRIDANNYYIQSGDMIFISDLIKELKSIL